MLGHPFVVILLNDLLRQFHRGKWLQELSRREFLMEDTTGSRGRSEPSDKSKRGIYSGRAATWLALAALLISIGHIMYAIWRDHVNSGEGLLSVLG